MAGSEPSTAPTGSLAYATDTELVRVKTDAGWIDVGAGGGGTVTEIDAGDGIVVTDPTGPIVTVEVDPAVLADIDGKLDEAFGNYSHVSSLQSTDRIAVNDDSAGLTPGYSTLADLAASLGVVNALTPWTAPPVGANFADEFTSDTLLTNYSVYNSTNSTAITTRVGDVVFTGTNTLANNEYRSTVFGDRLVVQFPASKNILVYRAVTAGDHLYTARAHVQATSAFCCLFTSATSGGLPDLNNATFIGDDPASSQSVQRYMNIGGATTTDGINPTYPNLQAFADRFVGTTRDSWAYEVFDGRISQFTTRTFTPTRAFFGFRFITSSTIVSSIFALDWLRELPSTSWLDSPINVVPNPISVVEGNGIDVTSASNQITITNMRAEEPLVGVSPSPDAWNLEARFWTSPDFAANGWSITERDTATVLTRAGEVDTSVNPSSGTYRSTLRGGKVIVQTRSGVIVQIAKAVTGTNNYTYKMHVRCLDYGTGFYAGGFVSDTLNPSTVGARFYSIGLEQTNVVENLRVGPSTNTTYFTGAAQLYYNDFVCCIRSTSANSQGIYYALTEGPGIAGSTGRNNNLTIAYAGVSLYSASSTGYFFLDFIRRSSASSFDLLC